ncbi:MAG TPA: DinB family protein [Terriglobia bacterium]|nr:DinB family protein [Terriglobia bacterium]
MTTRPDSTEYAPYYGQYIALVADGDIVATLAAQMETTLSLLRTLSEEQGGYAYAPGKWSIKELLGHVVDSERIFAYRALRIGRNDRTPLPGFEQDDYVASTDFNARPLKSLLEEFAAVRQANVQLFKHFTDEEWHRRGTANEKEVSARALAYIIAGHELHHLSTLKSLYLKANSGTDA